MYNTTTKKKKGYFLIEKCVDSKYTELSEFTKKTFLCTGY